MADLARRRIAIVDEDGRPVATADIDGLHPSVAQGPGVVVRCPVRDGSAVVGTSDCEGGEGVVVIVEVTTGVGDVGASGQANGADREVAEGGQDAGCGAGA